MASFDLGSKAFAVVGAIIGVIVVLAILGATIGDVFTNMDLVVNEFATYTNVNSAVLDAIVPVFAILVGIGIVAGLVTLVLRSTKM